AGWALSSSPAAISAPSGCVHVPTVGWAARNRWTSTPQAPAAGPERVSLLAAEQRRQLLAQLLHLQRCADEAVLAAIRADDHQIAAVVDGVVLAAGIAGDEGNADAVGERLDIVQRAGQAKEAFAEEFQVLFELLGRVTRRIDADQYRAQLLAHLIRQLATQLTQLGQRRRADVRAEGVAEEQQRPLAIELVHLHRLAVLIGQGQLRHVASLRQNHDAGVGHLSRIDLPCAIEHPVNRQPDDQRNQRDEDEYGFLDASHGFPC